MQAQHYQVKSVKFNHLAKVSLVGLIVTIAIAKIIIPGSVIGLIWLLPLLAPVYGILKNKPYTFAWSGFISGAYVAHAFYALMTAENVADFRFASFEILFSVGLFFGAVYYIKFRHLAKQSESGSADTN
jgi:uncharacterized membrane protein